MHVQHVRPNSGPHKKGPHKRTGKFLLRRDADNTVSVRVVWIQSDGEINKIDSDEQKRSSVFGEKKTGGDIAELDDD